MLHCLALREPYPPVECFLGLPPYEIFASAHKLNHTCMMYFIKYLGIEKVEGLKYCYMIKICVFTLDFYVYINKNNNNIKLV